MLQVNPSELAYGSDKTGLVWGYLFLPGEPPKQIEADAALEWLARPGRPGEFVWLHFSLSNAGAERWMRQSLQLADAFYESLQEGVGSTRLEVEGDQLVAVMHDVLFNLTFDASNISTVSLCMDPHLVVTARLRPLRSVDRLRASLKAGQSVRSTGELLAHLLHDQAEVLVDIIRQSTGQVDTVEDQLLANRISTSRSELSELRRSLVRLQRLLAPEPAALFRLLNRPPAWLSEADLGDLRQAAEEFSTSVVDAGALTERVKILQEELSALISENSNRTLYILTIVTVLALPINVVTGLLGMNVGGIPLSGHQQGFMLVVGSLTTITAVLAYVLLGRRRE
jgi:zinc transporter